MPKLIENVPAQLLTEARKQVVERGYAKTTIRSVASACGIAVGTVYNYFPSKEDLVAAFVAEDWKEALSAMGRRSHDSPEGCLLGIYEELLAFTGKHRALFHDPDAAKAISGGLLARHLQLREQLAALVEPFAPSEDGFTARFIAEALLTWTIANTPFARIYELLEKLIPKNKEEMK